MAKLFTDWLFAGLTLSTALMSICKLLPDHPLAPVGQVLGYLLAMLCLFFAILAVWLRVFGERLLRR